MKYPKYGTEVKIEWLDSHVSSIWEVGENYEFPHIYTRGIWGQIDGEFVCIIPTNSDDDKRLSSTFVPLGSIKTIYIASYNEFKAK